ncbi:LOW QUALITY PROTEIN: hypothetical protein V2J09_012481 [Rumex salicifolius]
MAYPGGTKGGWKAAIFIIDSGEILVLRDIQWPYYVLDGGVGGGDGHRRQEREHVARCCVSMSVDRSFRRRFVARTVQNRFLLVPRLSILKLRRPLVYLSLYIMAAGQGGHKPSVQTFAADQFDESTTEEKAAKSSFFNWWFFGVVVGSVSGIGTVFFVQKNVSWATGFMIPAAAMLVALAVFVAGTGFYRRGDLPAGSPFTKVAQVFVAAARKRRVSEDVFGILNGEETGPGPVGGAGARLEILGQGNGNGQQRLLIRNKKPMEAMHIRPSRASKTSNPPTPNLDNLLPFQHSLCSILHILHKASQHNERPPVIASLQDPGSIHSLLRNRVHHPHPPRFLRTSLRALDEEGHRPPHRHIYPPKDRCRAVFVYDYNAALIEIKRVRVASESSSLALSIWWLLPQYSVLGVAEVFVVVGMQQLFYEKMPEELRSLGAAAYLSVLGVGSFVSSGIIAVVQMVSSRFHEKWLVNDLNKAHLDGFYWVLAGFCGLGFCAYVWVASGFLSEEVVNGDEEM